MQALKQGGTGSLPARVKSASWAHTLVFACLGVSSFFCLFLPEPPEPQLHGSSPNASAVAVDNIAISSSQVGADPRAPRVKATADAAPSSFDRGGTSKVGGTGGLPTRVAQTSGLAASQL